MRKIISLICALTLLATSVFTVNVMPASAEDSEFMSLSCDFEGYKGDANLSLQSLRDYGGKWDAYAFAAGVTGITDVATDRGTSLNIINRAGSGKDYVFIRPCLPDKASGSLKIKFSFNFRDLVRGYAVRLNNSQIIMQNIYNKVSVMGNAFSQPAKTEVWYDFDISLNLKNGYYVASITSEGRTETFEGVYSAAIGKSYNFMDMGYYGGKGTLEINNLWLDDLYFAETEDFCKSALSENDFETFEGNENGTKVPDGFTASGIASGVNGLYSDNGKIRIVTGNTTPLTLEKSFGVTDKIPASVFGTIRFVTELNLSDKNADRSILIGSREIAKFSSDGSLVVGTSSASYETGVDYKVAVKINASTGEIETIVSDESGEVASGNITMSSSSITKAVLKTVQTSGSSETFVDSFSIYDDNGFKLVSSTPADGSKNLKPQDVTITFSNPIESVDYITLAGDTVNYEITEKNKITVYTSSMMDYGEDYELELCGLTDIFGETKDFSLKFSTIVAKSLGTLSLEAGDKVTAKVTGVANDGQDHGYTLVMAQYNETNNMLVDIETTDFTLEDQSKEFSVSLVNVPGAYYEAYLWDSFDSKNVLSDKVTFGIEPYAEVKPGDDGFTEDMDTGVVTASNIGINPEGYSVLVVLKPGKTPEDIETSENLTDVIDFIKQFDSKTDDVVSYTPCGGNGIYSYILDGNYVTDAFDYIDPSYVSMVYDEINKEDADFAECVKEYNRILACDTTELDTFDDDKNEELNSIIREARDKYVNGFETIASFHDAYYKAVANILIKYSEKASDVQAAFEKYGKEYGIENLSTYKTYAEANNTAKAEVYTAVANAAFEDKDTFEKVDAIVSGTIILAAIRNSQTQAQIGNIISENNDTVLKLDLSGYNKITNKSALHTKLIGANVYSAEEFKAIFDKAVAERLKEEENEKDVSEGIVPAGNSVFHDFETYVGDDASLSIKTLQDWSTGWGAYGLGEGLAGPTSVKSDRGTSINLINRDTEGKYGSAQVRTYAKTKIETSFEVKLSFRPIEFNVSSVVYFFGEGNPNQLTATLVRSDDNNINLLGTYLGFKPVVNEWYDITYKINKVSGYYEATLTCGDNVQTVKGINETIRNFKSFTGIGVGFSGTRKIGNLSQMWIDDITIREIEPFYLTLDDKSDFENFNAGSLGTTAPDGFEGSGVVKNENGFYSEDGALVMKTAKEGELALTKKFDFASGYTSTIYGTVRTTLDVNIPDLGADRTLKMGGYEIAKFGSDGKFSVGDASVDYETGKDYRVTVKANPSKLTDDKGETYYNKVTVIVSDESGEVFNGSAKVPDGSITSLTLSVSQTGDSSDTIVKSFDVCTDNGFHIESASPVAYETDVVPCDAEFVFSNAVSEIESVTLNDVPVDFEYTSDKSIKVSIESLLEYNQKYVINIIGAKDKFGETKDFKHTFYTVYASSLSDISIVEGDDVKASVSGFSHDGNKYTYTLVLASFDGQTNTLKNIKKTNITLGANAKEISVSVPKTEGAYYEAYVWDGVRSMVAIKNKASYGTNALLGVQPGKDGYVQNMDTLVLTATNTGIKGEGRSTLLILKPGKTMNDIGTASDISSVIEYIGQFDNAAEDVYAFTPSAGGNYGVAINGVFKANAFTYVDKTEVDSVFEKLNNEDAIFAEVIENHNNVLGVDTKELSGFDQAQKARLEQLIGEERAKLSEGFETCSDFANAYDYAVSRVVIETAKSAADIKTAFEKYGAGLGMKDFVAYKTYETLSDEGKNAIYADIAKTEDLSTVAKIEDAFAKATILRAVQYAGNYVDIANIIKDNNDYLGFDLKIYNSLKKQSAVNKALVGNYYSTIAKLEAEFEDEVSKQKKSESGDGGSSTGGGSGSSKGFGNSGLTLGPVVESPAAQNGFTDLDNHAWAKEAIDSLASKGIISGRSETVFDPSANITREEFTKIIVCAFTEVDTNLECNFTDVAKDAWYYSYVATAQKIGLINGTSATTFGTGEKITRQDMATILYRACEIFGIELNKGTLSFTDADSVSDYAKDAVASLSASGIINGKGNNNFEPLNFATRAESAKMIYETLERGDK